MMDLIDDEGFACELMDVCVEVGIAFARAQVNAGVDTVGIGDAVASLVNPHTYDKLIQPREKQIVKSIKKMGARVKLHICGNITHLLPGIADLGIDILQVDHMVKLSTVRDTVGDRVTIAGNMDPVACIMDGEPAMIKKCGSKHL